MPNTNVTVLQNEIVVNTTDCFPRPEYLPLFNTTGMTVGQTLVLDANGVLVPGSGGGGSGTVTSVGLTMPGLFTVSGSPVTTSGTIGVSLASVAPNTVLAGATSGTAIPTFRVLTASDIPDIVQSQVTNLVSDLGGKQPLDSDLTSIASLTPANDDLLQYKAGSWANRSIAQVKADLALSGTNTGDQTITLTGDITGSGTGSFSTTLANTPVTPGSYTVTNITVDAKGRLLTATSGTKADIGLGSVPNVDTTNAGNITSGTLANARLNPQVMLTTVYDPSANGVVDNSEALGGQPPGFYLARSNHAGTQTASTISDFTSVSQSSVGAILTDTATVDLTFSIGSITADVKPGSITPSLLSFTPVTQGDLYGLSIVGDVTSEVVDGGYSLRLNQVTNGGTFVLPTLTVGSNGLVLDAFNSEVTSGLSFVGNTLKRNKVVALVDGATVNVDANLVDVGTLTLSQNIILADPTGTFTDGQGLKFRFKNPSTYTVAYGGAYRGSTDVPLPVITANVTTYVYFEYNATDSLWDCLAVSTGY